MMATGISQSPHILVAVDDDSDDVDLLRLLLRKAGITQPAEYFRRGEELVDSLSKLVEQATGAVVRPMLCFLDVKMPTMTGHDVLRWIRSHRSLDRMPVVMLSSSDDPRDIREAASCGAQCYLAKYPQPSVLREVVDEAERFALGAPADECFRSPTNLLLVRARRVV